MDGAPSQAKQVLSSVAGRFVLFNRVGDGLAGEPVLQFHRGDGEAVDEEGEVQRGLSSGVAVPELLGDGGAVLPVALLGLGVGRGRSTVEKIDLVLSVADAIPEYVDDSPVDYLLFQPGEKLPFSGGVGV